MKVLMVMPDPGGLTGAPRRLLYLSESLNKLGIETTIATNPDSELYEHALSIGLRVYAAKLFGRLKLKGGALFSKNPLHIVKTFYAIVIYNLKLSSEMKNNKYDLIWVRGSKGIAFVFLTKIFSRKKLVWDIDYEPPRSFFVSILQKTGLALSDIIIFQYKNAPNKIFNKREINKYKIKFQYVHPGIDFNRMNTENKKFHKVGDTYTIIQVGTICPRKNQVFTLDVLYKATLKGLNTNWQLLLSFGQFDDKNLLKKISQYGFQNNVKLLGWRNDIAELVANSDLFVMPSLDEGVPNALQEAMLIGKPAIVSDGGGMEEIIIHGETGHVIPLSEVNKWVECILQHVNNIDFSKKIGSNASEYAIENFRIDNWAKKYSDLLLSL